MSVKRTFCIIFAAVIMIILIAMPEVCITGARNGLLLWFEIVIPTLFPFFVLTKLILELGLCPKVLQPYYPVFTGLISGYPTGAFTCSEMVQKGMLPRDKAQLMLVLCNNASPAFLISYAAHTCLRLENSFLIWFCTIGGSFITYIFLTLIRRFRFGSVPKECFTQKIILKESGSSPFLLTLENTIMKSFEILILVGGYIILASLAINLACTLLSGSAIAIYVSGMLEITTGIKLITTYNYEGALLIYTYIKSAAVAALCGFGGISALMQTHSAIRISGLSTLKYMFHKLICGVVSGILCILYMYITY